MRSVGRGRAARAPVPLRLTPLPRAAARLVPDAFVAEGFVPAGFALATTFLSGDVSIVGASTGLLEPFARVAATFANPRLPCPLDPEPRQSLADRRSASDAAGRRG